MSIVSLYRTPASTLPVEKNPVVIVDEAVVAVSAQEAGYLPFRYSVPGVVTIGSAVRLPELEWFRDPFLARGPFDIEIVIGKVGRLRRRTRLTRQGTETLQYEEHLGGRAANFRLEQEEDRIRITASPVLARSPHVLYTNVVEALLRFMAVSRGRVLLHSACVEIDGRGVMLSARTDTGKTGTILRLLRDGGARFLSDDMTVLNPDGVAECYPKPLTISHHTLRAVNADVLTRAQWHWLRVQSRLHSKEGRQFGMRLAEMNLPIMTMNALTQAIVPPPKFDADRLVACDVVRRVEVDNMFIIERGGRELSDVSTEQAMTELIENTDDAYGFPPFRYLAPSFVIGGRTYAELRERESELLFQAISNIRVRRMARDDFGWADRIVALLAEDRDPSIDELDLTGEEPLQSATAAGR